MATNHFFKNFNSFPQQQLLNNLTKEVIQMSGIDVLYLPRIASSTKDTLLNEDSLVSYSNAYQIEMYINTTTGFEGGGDIASKFGLDILDELILVVNKERFSEEAPLANPREGDLIYLPLGKGLFTVKFVEHENPFYSLGKNTVHELSCELFRYSNEQFNISAEESGSIFNKIERQHATSVQLEFPSNSATVWRENEIIFQGEDLASATVTGKVASQVGNKINVYRVLGNFVVGNDIKGNLSDIVTNLNSIDDQVMSTSEFDDNEEFETEGDNILDFSEIDPWSEGDL
tara:strand:- start:19 stop:882 length:864 start_codon:yes stop_codon:yes gene_type:complete